MKRIINTMLAASILTAGMVGCDRAGEPGKTAVEGGDKRPVTFSIQPHNAVTLGGTRATTNDPNGTAAEAEIKSLDIYIYTDGGAFLRHQNLADNSKFTQLASQTGYDVWETNSGVVTVDTGTRMFLVGANLPNSVATTLDGQPLSAAERTIQTIARTAITTLPTTGIPMFSTGNVTATITATAATNKVTVPIKRIVAKTTVYKATSMVQEGATGKLGAFSWTVNHQNSKFYLKQGSLPNSVDPNWTATQYNATDFTDSSSAGDYVAAGDEASARTSDIPLYMLENTSDKKTTQELTRVTVKATFIPAKWITAHTAGVDPTTERVDNTNYSSNTVTDFWTVNPGGGADTEYFSTEAEAQKFANEKSVAFNKFAAGVCYWNVYVNKDRQGEVIRNDYYQLRITKVIAPGQNSDALNNPTGTVAQETTMTADVQVLNWNTPIKNDVTLAP